MFLKWNFCVLGMEMKRNKSNKPTSTVTNQKKHGDKKKEKNLSKPKKIEFFKLNQLLPMYIGAAGPANGEQRTYID